MAINAQAVADEINSTTARNEIVLPRPEAEFKGKIGRTAAESIPDFPKLLTAPAHAPNVLLIMTDDVGFGASGTFGGLIPTPTFSRLASNGLRYNAFNTTAICSPSRAALLTGRNHHSVGTATVQEMSVGYPGYNSIIPKSAGTVAEVLRLSGYNTAMFGKHHNIPTWELSQNGPYDHWPTGLGFEYFYGFLAFGTNQWSPSLYLNTQPIEPPLNDPDYHLDRDLADNAIQWVHQQKALSPNKPFFMYYAPGTAHAPHHAPREWIARFKGQFDQGWDQAREEIFARQKAEGIIPASTRLTPRPKGIPAWNSLSADQKKVYARMMEVYAASLAHMDYQIGRLLDSLAQMDQLDNTLVIFVQGDNGASAEGTLNGSTDEVGALMDPARESMPYLLGMIDQLGGPTTFGHYPVGWAWAMNTPFQWTKQLASHFGGIRNGFVISWPQKFNGDGSVRPQFHHLIDVMPTILDAAGVKAPTLLHGVKQKPIEGVSMVYTFDQPVSPTHRNTQYFEEMGNRGIYHDGWFANTTPKREPWNVMAVVTGDVADDYQWELYDLGSDFSQANNLAAKNPERLKAMQKIWWEEAHKYQVLPLDDSFLARAKPGSHPEFNEGRTSFTYLSPITRIQPAVAPNIFNRSFAVTANVMIPKSGADGVLATWGGRFGGWSFLVHDRKPVIVHAVSQQAQHQFRIVSEQPLPEGSVQVRFEFAYDGGGRGKGGDAKILVNGKVFAEGRIERTSPGHISGGEGLDIGSDTGTPVTDDYNVPFRFGGELKQVTIDLL